MSTRRLVILLALAALPALAKPNFTGTWKMNVSKSNFGQFPAPDSATYKIAHDDPKLKISIAQAAQGNDMNFDLNYTTDGKESTNEMFGNAIKGIGKWDGDTVVIDAKGKFGDNEFTSNEKLTMSGDGKTLTIVRTFKSPMGDVTQTVVLDKQ